MNRKKRGETERKGETIYTKQSVKKYKEEIQIYYKIKIIVNKLRLLIQLKEKEYY